MKIVSCLESNIPQERSDEVIYICQYSNPKAQDIGYFGLGFWDNIRKQGIAPSTAIWDFATFALTVASVDKLISRNTSSDGWTRELDVEIHLCSPDKWYSQIEELQDLLRFLTGDFWTLSFCDGGSFPPSPKPIMHEADCISLLSGGMDSLIGAIDLTRDGKLPIFVSHVVKGSKNAQEKYASSLSASERLYQWSYNTKLKGYGEDSTRGRSMVFYAFAAIASASINRKSAEPIDLYVPENGFISLNIALSPGRLGSLSTKTTHPIYMSGLQNLWNHLGIPLNLKFPYRFKTKGEMMKECLDQDLLMDLVKDSVSCAKYGRKHIHCGVCVPCLVRRAAFMKVDWKDSTEYGKNIKIVNSDNISVAATSYLQMQAKGIRHVVGSALNFASDTDRGNYEGVFSRGLTEIYELLHYYGRV